MPQRRLFSASLEKVVCSQFPVVLHSPLSPDTAVASVSRQDGSVIELGCRMSRPKN